MPDENGRLEQTRLIESFKERFAANSNFDDIIGNCGLLGPIDSEERRRRAVQQMNLLMNKRYGDLKK
jgi:hypothetical protein